MPQLRISFGIFDVNTCLEMVDDLLWASPQEPAAVVEVALSQRQVPLLPPRPQEDCPPQAPTSENFATLS